MIRADAKQWWLSCTLDTFLQEHVHQSWSDKIHCIFNSHRIEMYLQLTYNFTCKHLTVFSYKSNSKLLMLDY